ncbi:PDZ domain-containing protein [Streptomyces sp. NPDC005774]|uniref:PDZ domain-containing protein n=1 Tax=Streptomyces sp. NPDC005774 TaxID=3364728 RepID=UPI0036AD78FB
MEQTALRPKPMPGRETAGAGDTGGGADRDGNGRGEGRGGGAGSGARRGSGRPRPHAARRRRGRRLRTTLFAMFLGTVLVLSGVGVGAMGATVVGADGLAELQRQAGFVGAAGPSARSGPSASGAFPSPLSAPVVARLGVEVVDDSGPGALVVGVHVPGPGFAAGLVRGDVLLAFGGTRIDTAADLVGAVVRARPGAGATLTVRHRGGDFQQLTAVPGLVT